MMSSAPERISMSMISSACSPVSGWETSSASVSTPSLLAYSGSSACSASMNAAMPPLRLGVGDRVQRHRGLTGGLRAVDLHDPATREPADAERDIERDRPGGDHLDRGPGLVAETHHRALAELAVDLAESGLEGLAAVCERCRHERCSFARQGCRATAVRYWAGLVPGYALAERWPVGEAMSDHRHPAAAVDPCCGRRCIRLHLWTRLREHAFEPRTRQRDTPTRVSGPTTYSGRCDRTPRPAVAGRPETVAGAVAHAGALWLRDLLLNGGVLLSLVVGVGGAVSGEQPWQWLGPVIGVDRRRPLVRRAPGACGPDDDRRAAPDGAARPRDLGRRHRRAGRRVRRHVADVGMTTGQDAS